MPASLSSAARHLSSTAVARHLPPCDAFTHPNSSPRLAVYYYRYLYPPAPAPNAFYWKGPRSVVGALLEWISSHPGSPDVLRNAIPTTIEADCIIVLPRRAATQPGLVSLKYCVLAFFVSLVLSTLYFRSIAQRGARQTSTRRRRTLRTTTQQQHVWTLSLAQALWASLHSLWALLWTYLNHIAQPNSTTQKRTIELTVDQDTWLRRFTSLSAHSSAASSSSHAAPTKFTSVSSRSAPSKAKARVRLPPDWHDWFKRSPPRPTPSLRSTTPSPLIARPTTHTPTTLSPRPTTTRTPSPRPTPLSPSKSQRRAALRPKANADRDRSRSKLRPVSRRPSVSVGEDLMGSSRGEDLMGSSSEFVLVPSAEPELGTSESEAPNVVDNNSCLPEPKPARRRIGSAVPSDDDFDPELFKAASIPLPLPDTTENLLDIEDSNEHETGLGAQEKKKKTRRSGRKWTRRRANAVAAVQEIF